MGLIIEVTGDTRTTRLENFSSVASGLLSIGRARDNDLILDDPYVDPYHGQIIFGETGTWSYQDLGSENGSKRGKESVNDCALTSADVLTLGKTRLQFFDPSHQVAPALSLHNSRQRLLSFNTWSTSGLLLIGAILTLALNIYVNYTGEKLDAGMLMGIFLGAFSLPLIVSTAWSLLAKILCGRSHFLSIVNVALVALIILELYQYPFIGVAYNFPAIDRGYLGVVLNLLVFGFYLYATLLICTRLKDQTNKLIAGLVPAVVFCAYLVIQISNADEHNNAPNYNGRLLAPVVLLRSGETPDEFIQRLPGIFDDADGLID
tara:strand:+ start:4453 stop:5409 length:957 start_codon:yes stop_codon:yes gene_type:complete